ncbi:MAG: aminotransferase class I/II-fold pyridoxal phosphate-dependent enzyme, partial [Methanobacteriota archaeon]
GKEDAIFSEELNHACIIDGSKLSGAKRYIYPHLNVAALEDTISREKEARRKLIVTDGVFSMDGDMAPLPGIVEVAEKYEAIVMVDDAHGEGVLGDHGRGIANHFGLHGKIEIEMGTLSKAFGVVGGYIAGNKELIEFLRQRARPFLFSSGTNPGDVAAAIMAVEMLEESDELVKKLWSNTRYFKEKLSKLGFDLGKSKTPITPLMVKDEKIAAEVSKKLFEEEKIFSQYIIYPTVPRGTARLRLQPSAVHSKEDLDYCINALEKIGESLNLI